MEKEYEKKVWIRPELIVLTRSKPEEAVLSVCKVMDELGPTAGYDGDEVYYQCDNSAWDGATPCYDTNPS